jgi:hypothetical protein
MFVIQTLIYHLKYFLFLFCVCPRFLNFGYYRIFSKWPQFQSAYLLKAPSLIPRTGQKAHSSAWIIPGIFFIQQLVITFNEILLLKKQFVNNDQLGPRPTRNKMIFLQHHQQNLSSCMGGIEIRKSWRIRIFNRKNYGYESGDMLGSFHGKLNVPLYMGSTLLFILI